MFYVKESYIVWNAEEGQYDCKRRPAPVFSGLSAAVAYAQQKATTDKPTLLIQSAQPFAYIDTEGNMSLYRDWQ